MRADDPAQQVEHRQADGDGDAVQDVDDEHGRRWWRGPAPARWSGSGPGGGSRRCRPDGWRRTRRRRRVRPAGRSRAPARGTAASATTTSSAISAATWLRAAAGDDHRRTAAAAADRKPLQQTGRDVGRAERQQLLVGADRRIVPGGEGPPGEHVVGEADGRDARGRERHLDQVERGDVGHLRHRQTARHLTDHGQTQAVGADDRHHDRRGDHDDQHPRPARPDRSAGASSSDHHDAAQDQGGVVDPDRGAWRRTRSRRRCCPTAPSSR